MSEPKPVASLSSGLLARKGEAHPAMRRSHVPMASLSALPVAVQNDAPGTPAHDSLGWNDLGVDLPGPAVVREQQKRIARSFARPAGTPPAAAPARMARVAFTLRLDAERHLRLRLASAVDNCSAQQIVTEALDAFLGRRPGLDALVAQVHATLLRER